jgi:ketosteroid isomerase-like protein
MQQLKRASVDPIFAPHKEVVDLTIRDADEIYRIARDQYLKGYKEKNESLSASAGEQETFVVVAVDNAVILFNKSNPDFTNNLGEYAVSRLGEAREHYGNAAVELAAYSLRTEMSAVCETSIESLSQELNRGLTQISLVEHLDVKSNPEEYYLRVNYGDMLISNVSDKLLCYKIAATHVKIQKQSEEGANQQEQAQGSPAGGSEAPQEPTPVPIESSKPSAVQPAPASTTPTESQGEAATDNVNTEVSRALENWAKANESNDPTLLANCYAEQVDRFFLQTNVTNTFVHDYWDTWFKEHDSRVTMFKIKDMTFENETAATVTLRLDEEVVTTGSKGTVERLIPAQLYLKKVGREWKITSEQDFK